MAFVSGIWGCWTSKSQLWKLISQRKWRNIVKQHKLKIVKLNRKKIVKYQVLLVFLAILLHWPGLWGTTLMLLMAGKIDWYPAAFIMTLRYIRRWESMTLSNNCCCLIIRYIRRWESMTLSNNCCCLIIPGFMLSHISPHSAVHVSCRPAQY